MGGRLAVEVGDARVLERVLHQLRLAVPNDPARHALVDRKRACHVLVGGEATREGRLQDLLFLVVDRDGHVVHPQQSAEAIGDLLDDRGRIERRQDRLRDAHQLTLARQLLGEPLGLRLELLGDFGVRDGLGRDRRVDLEVAQVVAGELVHAQLGEHDDADDAVLVEHRREDHRLVEVGLRARDRLGARILRRVRQVLRDAVLGDPAGDAFADLEPELLAVLVGVLADLAPPGDGVDVLTVDRVDAHVVVVDELPELRADRLADLRDLAQAVETRAELLDGLELCGPGGHLLVVAGVLDGHAGLRAECLEDVQVWASPAPPRCIRSRGSWRTRPRCARRAGGGRRRPDLPPNSSIACWTRLVMIAGNSRRELSSRLMRASERDWDSWSRTRTIRRSRSTATWRAAPTDWSRSRSARSRDRCSALSTTTTPHASSPMPIGAKTSTLEGPPRDPRDPGAAAAGAAIGRPSRRQTSTRRVSTWLHHVLARCAPSVARGRSRPSRHSAMATMAKRPVSRRPRAAARMVVSISRSAQLLRPEAGEDGKVASLGDFGPRRLRGHLEHGVGAFPGLRFGAKAAGKWSQRRRLHAGHGQERSEVGHAVAAVAALVDAQAPQPPLVCPGADRVRMNSQQPGSTCHGQVDGFGSRFDVRCLRRNW